MYVTYKTIIFFYSNWPALEALNRTVLPLCSTWALLLHSRVSHPFGGRADDLWMTLKCIRRWARFLDVKLRLDHTLSQSTDELRSDNSLFQIVLIERGFVIQSIIVLYIKETDGRPADGAIQSRIGWEEMEEDQGTPYALRAERNWRKTKYADAGRQNLVLNVWNEQRPWLSYTVYHRTCLHPK